MRRLLVTLALASFAATAHAQWYPTGAPVVTRANTQNLPAIASDGVGGSYVVWNDFRSGDWDLYAQHLLASGYRDPAWPADGALLCAQPGTQSRPCLVADGAGGAFVSWIDRRNGASYQSYLHRLIPAGPDPAWPADGRLLSSVYPALDKEVQLALDGAGGVYALCPQLHASTDYRVQRVSAAGVVDPAFGSGVLVGTANFTGGRYENIASDGAGGALVAFTGPNFSVALQRVLPAGVADPAWPSNGRVLTAVTAGGGFPVVVPDGAGGGIVVWNHFMNSDVDIRAQHVLGSGALDAVWPDTGLVVSDAPSSQQTPFAASDGAGGAIVAWSDMRTDNQFDVYAHRVLASGAVDGAWPVNGKPLIQQTGTQFARAVLADGAGGAIVLWEDSGSPARGLYALRLGANGAVAPGWRPQGAWLTGASHGTTLYGFASDAATRDVHVAWDEFRLGPSNARDLDVYARRIPVTGTRRISTTQTGVSGGYVLVPDSLSIYASPQDALSTLDMAPQDQVEFRFPSYIGQSVVDVTANGQSLGPAPNHVFRNVTADVALLCTVTTSLWSVETPMSGGSTYAAVAWPMTYTRDSVSTLLDELWPTDDRMWRFARWNPVTSAYDYAGGALTRIQPGHGYWLASRSARNVVVAGRPLYLPTTDVPLLGGATSGWNQVANPYRFPIADSALRVVAGASVVPFTGTANAYTDSTVWEWASGTGYTRVHTLSPNRAYWVRKSAAGSVALRFPNLTSVGRAEPPTVRPDDADWALALTASQGGTRTPPALVGAWRAAAAAEPLRREAPPASPEGGLRLTVARAAAGRVNAETEFVPAGASAAWQLDLAGAESPGELTLEVAAFDMPDGLTLQLSDPALGWSRAVSPGERITLAATPGTRRLQLEAREGIPQPAEETGPRVFAAWPNPFRGSLGFTAQLVAASDLRVDIVVDIMDVQGRVIRTLERRGATAGESVIVWDGRGSGGAVVRPGVYLARWRAAGREGTVRLVKLD
ncbi:MAG: hypothetical protein IT348_11745 [Candidatus Eisenbacteria bacterium]|nr:hypothetical protein [Candidatus Eisenbacteria bacterium]